MSVLYKLVKILYLTGGAGQMYCGSCLRDNALATELISRGHDVTLLPVYTPTLTDEANVSEDKVFFGGISVYLEQYVPFFRKSPKWIDRLWDSKSLLNLASRRSLSTSPQMLGELTVSMLKGEDGFQRKEIAKLVEWLKYEGPPDIVSLPYTLLLGLAQPLTEALGRPICCTLQGEDLFLEGLEEPYRSESKRLIRANLKHIDAFIAVSEYYAEFMPTYLGIPREKIRVVPLGINLEGYEKQNSEPSGQFTVGFFARIAPEKGLHVLADAYRRLRARGDLPNARLEAAGYLAPEHKGYLQDIEQEMNRSGFGNEFQYRGVLDREQKIAFLQTLDVLSVPATYDEPKGMFLLEAMACGVPVLQPRRGGFTELVEATGGGELVEPDNPEALAAGILKLQRDPALVRRLGESGFENVRQHYSVARMADRALEAYESVLT
ncbi:MAG TPA: glycosyltransferase family 4 protein [Pyrinomonadaceae bacterium]|jgi:glycosyltransferase involved in cell wall biosynthesis|nr:glycosyltransferase family 4 protein [Pyrinomonadaceae bacterium]